MNNMSKGEKAVFDAALDRNAELIYNNIVLKRKIIYLKLVIASLCVFIVSKWWRK